ncbi:MAG: DUF1016 family protein [Bacilli bacterium]|nr:DUF1016 family protein [Bacilli bacterium]
MIEKLDKVQHYNEMRNVIIKHEIFQNVKDYSKEKEKVTAYFEIGKLVSEAGSIYGNNTINEFSKKLTNEFGKTYSYRNLVNYRKFYNIFKDEKLNALRSKLSWTHYRELIKLKDIEEIIYYIEVCLNQHLSYRKLSDKIKNKEYDRLDYNTKLKLINNEESTVIDLVKNPVKIKNNSNYEIISEKVLQKLILEDIENFLEELGNGFTFIKSEYPIKFEEKYNYVDLLLYNIKFKCYVVTELKITELKKEHTGQIQTYMNYIDENIKTIEESKTVGIIICKKIINMLSNIVRMIEL